MYLLGIDIGGTKCAAVLGQTVGDTVEVRERIAFATEAPQKGPNETLQRLCDAARTLLVRHGLSEKDVAAVGVSCGGPLDSRRGLVLSPPNLPGWDAVPATQRLEESLKIPCRLQNDANAGALAEWRWGAGRGCRSMIFLTFGTGLGAGLVLDGRLLAGPDDLAGEVGHIRLAEQGPVGYGKAGSFEGFCSGGGIRRLAEEGIRAAWSAGRTVAFCPDEASLVGLDARQVAEAAHQGDLLAGAVFATSAHYLGRGLALLIDLLNPEAIVLGGIYGRCEDLLQPAAMEQIAREALPAAAARCRILPAQLGESIGDYAALAVALDSVPQSKK